MTEATGKNQSAHTTLSTVRKTLKQKQLGVSSFRYQFKFIIL